MVQDGEKLDNRTLENMREKFSELAKSYVPEWSFDAEDPDIGSVLALIFTNQLFGNKERFNQTLDRYHTELANLLDLSLLPAKPASALVLMELIPDTVSGLAVSKGTKLLADSDGENIVFETRYPVYLTESRLRSIFMTSDQEGRILPVFGKFKKKEYVVTESKLEADLSSIQPFELFCYSKEGIEQQAMLLYHSNIFDVENDPILCRMDCGNDFLEQYKAGEFRFLYYTDEGFLPIENTQVLKDGVMLVKEKKNKKIEMEDRTYSMLVLEAVKPQNETRIFDSISFSSAGGLMQADYIGNGSNEYDVEHFEPFSDTLSLFSECYIGMDPYFSKKNARITLRFQTSFGERYVGLTKQQEEENLKIIKKKPRVSVESMMSYAYAEEIAIEYYNGIGWKRLTCEKDYKRMFAQAENGEYELSFSCPEDWKPASFGAYAGRSLRIQLLKADNCYIQPCTHRYPSISCLRISYSYEEHFEKPEIGIRLFGSLREDFTRNLKENKVFTGFSKGNYHEDAIYLGFDKPFDNGPISLWWKISSIKSSPDLRLRFFYSTIHGFKEMKMVDYTENLTKTGTMLFLPASDMSFYELEEKKLIWLKIIKEGTEESTEYPLIEDIKLNAVEVANIESKEEEEYYLDTVEGGMSFSLPAEGILDADVWVNEKNDLTDDDMQVLLSASPECVRTVVNAMGNMEEFYVKWEEVESFHAAAGKRRCYVLDRLQRKIVFGDGISVKIPRNMEGVAFTVKIRSCLGQKGNVLAGTITESNDNLMFVSSIINPDPAFGGSSMETVERALMRSAAYLSSGGRLVTQKDYTREVLSYSDAIDKVSIISGVDRYGNIKERMLYIVLLMRDFGNGSMSINSMRNELKEHLIQHCELSVLPNEISIEEPVAVELNVDLWIQIIRIEDSFGIQTLVEQTLKEYLNPVSMMGRRGWEIGVLPRKAQIMMKLNVLKSKAVIQQMMIVAKYQDATGMHEIDLEDLRTQPFMVVKSGQHKVHIVKAGNF